MPSKIQSYMDEGKRQLTIMTAGGNAQVSLKVEIDGFDQVGMVARVKGMMGGMGDPQCFPWATVSSVKFGW